jgi:GNAT superfamily N-acetyltransferase
VSGPLATPGEGARPWPEPRAAPAGREWRVRGARNGDVPRVAAAVHALLRELGATPPPALAMQATARTLLEDPAAGAVLVAEADGTPREPGGALVGVLGLSWQTAIHAAGAYALIQDLWVHPAWRGLGVGGGLLRALYAHARERGVTRVEVGLPRPTFTGLAETEAFYLAHSFAPLGTRMRRALP